VLIVFDSGTWKTLCCAIIDTLCAMGL